jgi:hypothetical protein
MRFSLSALRRLRCGVAIWKGAYIANLSTEALDACGAAIALAITNALEPRYATNKTRRLTAGRNRRLRFITRKMRVPIGMRDMSVCLHRIDHR